MAGEEAATSNPAREIVAGRPRADQPSLSQGATVRRGLVLEEEVAVSVQVGAFRRGLHGLIRSLYPIWAADACVSRWTPLIRGRERLARHDVSGTTTESDIVRFRCSAARHHR